MELNDTILVVDDEFLIAQGLCMQVEDMGLRVCGTAGTADEALEMAERHRPSVVLMDVRLHGSKDGVDAALAIHKSVGSRVIFITGSRETSTLDRIALDHPAGILFKPVSGSQLQSAIQTALAA
jgi:DNA-binding NarL/FixJ family response regulator